VEVCERDELPAAALTRRGPMPAFESVNARLSLSFARAYLTMIAEFKSPIGSSLCSRRHGSISSSPISRLPTVTSDTRFLSFRLTVYILYNLHLSSPSFSFYVVGPVPTYARDGTETRNAGA